MTTLYPSWYGAAEFTLDELMGKHHEDKMVPEYARRLRAWLAHKGGKIGIGGSWRDDGSQPDKPGFAPEGKSFHQYQQFASGLVAFCAVDLVAVDGPDADPNHDGVSWSDVPQQGSDEAKKWGLHANVGTPASGEAWHLQPIEIDGWQTWINAGSPDIQVGYPIPGDPGPTPPQPTPVDPLPETEDPDMPRYLTFHNDPSKPTFPTPVFEQLADGFTLVHVNAKRWAKISKLPDVKLENAGPDAAAYRTLVGGIDDNGDWSHITAMFGQRTRWGD